MQGHLGRGYRGGSQVGSQEKMWEVGKGGGEGSKQEFRQKEIVGASESLFLVILINFCRCSSSLNYSAASVPLCLSTVAWKTRVESHRTRGPCSLLSGAGAGHCPWAQAAHVSLCVQQEKCFSFAVSRLNLEPVWLLCLQSQWCSPGGSNSTFSPWSSQMWGWAGGKAAWPWSLIFIVCMV